MKVFVVTSGSYSDFGISAIFSTLEKAQRYAKEYGTDNAIEEYLVDEDDDKICRPAFIAMIDLETGEILRKREYPLLATKHERSRDADISDFREMRRNQVCESWGRITAEVTSFVSEAHALKLASEARQKFLRDKAQQNA